VTELRLWGHAQSPTQTVLFGNHRHISSLLPPGSYV